MYVCGHYRVCEQCAGVSQYGKCDVVFKPGVVLVIPAKETSFGRYDYVVDFFARLVHTAQF